MEGWREGERLRKKKGEREKGGCSVGGREEGRREGRYGETEVGR